MKAHLLAAASLCLAGPALAQTGAQTAPASERPDEEAAPRKAQPTDATGAEIVVIGEGLPDTPSVTAYASRELTREQIVAAPSGRIEEVLGAVAGFQQFRRSDSRSSNPSAQGVTLRALGGNATSRALVLLDGLDEGGVAREEIEQHVIEALAPQGHALLCTSRPSYIDKEGRAAASERFSGFRLLKLAPLSEVQQLEVLSQRLGEALADQAICRERIDAVRGAAGLRRGPLCGRDDGACESTVIYHCCPGWRTHS